MARPIYNQLFAVIYWKHKAMVSLSAIAVLTALCIGITFLPTFLSVKLFTSAPSTGETFEHEISSNNNNNGGSLLTGKQNSLADFANFDEESRLRDNNNLFVRMARGDSARLKLCPPGGSSFTNGKNHFILSFGWGFA